MATPITYVNFNTDKTIDELLYNTDQYKYRFKTLEAELKFYKFLIEANIFKPKVINLFERLTTFDKKIGAYSNQIEALHLELTTHKKEIKNKIECDNLECDAFFIEKHTSIERKSHHLFSEINDFKSELLQYFQSTIKTI